ncbi:hypothetical protein DQ04_05661000 [Trypanosoma grayi]|uniref:hypothetical protein n=1 Tax=Trypanosoma grayi TaxID=71804 RepID=UPI0004F403C2|nr:hypothetical protein DQ04_05661000 [Trypanosoma grayi]KEG09178.1 hypothetical protein DQ04_05661000 [Trypanosoma grayi]
MSVKVPYESVQYQSHHHCQCDFCNSRRTVNAKKFGVSSTVAQLQALQRKNNCCCSCHEVLASRSLGDKAAPSFELDDPEHHVNQTALNTKMGRTGIPGGDKYTITSGGPAGGSKCGSKMMTREEQEKEAMDDLDRLERLLILEHKARVKATTEAERLNHLRSTGKGLRPQPFDACAERTENNGAPLQQLDAAQASTIREAYDRAQRCSVTPPPHCEASHRLQHTIDDVRAVARDPINRNNAAALQQVLYREGVPGATPTPSETCDALNGVTGTTVGKRVNYSGPRPEGAGVVWRKFQPSIQESPATAAGGLGNVDNRDLWKSTVVKGGSTVKQQNGTVAVTNGGTAAAPMEKSSPGAEAAMKVQQQGRQSEVDTPLPTVRCAEETRI